MLSRIANLINHSPGKRLASHEHAAHDEPTGEWICSETYALLSLYPKPAFEPLK